MSIELNLKQWAALGTLALAAGSALAADPDSATPPRSRAEVVAEVLAARAAGTLAPAGEHAEAPAATTIGQASRTRAEVEAEVLEARRTGQLIAAGEGELFPAVPASSGPVLTRATVKAEVLAARAAGELVPAGEGPFAEAPVSTARHDEQANVHTRTASLSR